MFFNQWTRVFSAMNKVFILLFSYFLSVNGHGYLFEPVARSSAWLVDRSFKQCCTYANHMEMFCGGIGHQWNVNSALLRIFVRRVFFSFFRRKMQHLRRTLRQTGEVVREGRSDVQRQSCQNVHARCADRCESDGAFVRSACPREKKHQRPSL